MKVVVKQNVIDMKPELIYKIELNQIYRNYDYDVRIKNSIVQEYYHSNTVESIHLIEATIKLYSLINLNKWDIKTIIRDSRVGIVSCENNLRQEPIKELEFDITPLSIGDSVTIDSNKCTIDKIGYNSDNDCYEIIVEEIKYVELDHNFDLDKETELLRTEVEKVLDEIRTEREKAMVNETISEIVNEKENKTIIDRIKELIDGIRHSRRNRR